MGLTVIEVVVTSHNQGDMVREAVESVLAQSVPATPLVVDDGSTDALSLAVLVALESRGVRILRQSNAGVSAARNAGVAATTSPLVGVLDGDDAFEPTFLERAQQAMRDSDVIAASSWLMLVGVASGVVRPEGGELVDFLHRNACPASALLRRNAFERAGGYQVTMRHGFEDWDLFLAMLREGGRIEIVNEPLIRYRTVAGSSNVRSMDYRLDLFGELIDRHRGSYDKHLREVLITQEGASMKRLARWEELIVANADLDPGEATYGDGGMASLVRIQSSRAAARQSYPAPQS